nr:alpha/beta fold hydrolase [Parvularcula mediterranea]
MDAWEDALGLPDERLTTEDLGQHFKRAEDLAHDPRLDPAFEPQAILKLIPAPALLLGADGRVLAGNEAGREAQQEHGLGDELAGSFEDQWPPSPDQRLHVLAAPEGGSLIVSVSTIPTRRSPGPLVLVQFEATAWSPSLSEALKTRFSLTPAEINVVRLLSEGKAVAEIASEAGKSPETIRSQLKSVQTKTGEHKQSGLLFLVARLRFLVGSSADAPAISTGRASGAFSTKEHTLRDGRKLAVSTYGAPDGKLVLYLTTSSLPWEDERWREAVADRGLRIIAPHRPGHGGSSRHDDSAQNGASLARYLLEAIPLRRDQPLVIAGHREGGILAAEAAKEIRDRTNFQGTVLISTGAPQAPEAFGSASRPMRRSFKAAHLSPAALRLGYRVAKGLFESGLVGEKRTVEYFFNDSPRDRKLTEEPRYWQITRDLIAYCFENSDQIAWDIGRWTSDWEGDLLEGSPPWTFIHGSEHDFMPMEPVEAFCSANPSCRAVRMDGLAQLALYERPDFVAQTIADIFSG